MKRCKPLLICLLAMSAASADSLSPRPMPQQSPPASPVAAVSLVSAQTGIRQRWPRARQATRSDLADLKADVVQDMRATSAFVQEQANKAGAPSRWLIALAAFGLIMMQLRRKHKSLPQRRIAPYG